MSWLLQHAELAIVLRAALWFVLATAVFLPLEALTPLRDGKRGRHERAANLGWFALNSVITLPLLAVPAAVVASIVALLVPDAVPATVATLPLGVRMVLAMIVGEIGFYWGHRWSHEWAWLWRFHAVHHSAEHLTYLANTRMHPIDMIFTRLCGLTLLYVTGLAAPAARDAGLIVATVLIGGSLWSYFVHANLRWRLGPLEQVLATPAFHHWHHSRDDHRDHNYAAMLPVIDRLFGTHYLPRHWPSAYGTDTPVPYGVIGQLIAPFRSDRPTLSAPTLSEMPTVTKRDGGAR